MTKNIRTFFLLFIFLLAVLIQKPLPAQSTNSKGTNGWYKGGQWLNGLSLKPHESVNKKEFEKQYKAHQAWWDKAFAFLKDTDLESLKPGKHVIDGENVFALVTHGTTKDSAQTRWEAHKIYLDIHYVFSGKEKIGIGPVASATPSTDFDTAKDIGFYTAKGKYYQSKKGTFFIAFPQDAHRPNIKVDGNDAIKKIVIKIRAGA